MPIKVVYSTETGIDQALAQLKKEFSGCNPRAVIFFASTAFDPDALAKHMQKNFPDCPTFGCSTAGEIASGCMLNNSIVAMGLDAEIIDDIAIQVLNGIKGDPKGAVDRAFLGFQDHTGTSMQALDFTKYIGLILVDGMTGTEERLMDRIGDLTNITFIGGSAGDDLKFRQTWVFAQGKAYSNAAVLVLIKSGRPFEILKTQSFRPLNKKLVATKVNEAAREVIEFNGQPAAAAYAEAVGATPETLADCFMRAPLGLMVGDEPYVRSPQRIEGSSVFFFCNIREGMELALLESQDIVRDTAAALADKKAGGAPVSGILNFNCILRTLELKSKNELDAYGKVFAGVPTAGFSTYGEEYLGHINQTSAMLIFR